MDDLNLDLNNIESNAEQNLQVKDRFAKLTQKGLEAENKAQAEAEAKVKAEERAAKAEKDLEFYKSFSQVSAKYPGASDFQDQIKERVDKGYDPEDATIAVLNREGKLGNQQVQSQPRPNVAGGSAPTDLGNGGTKTAKEMSQEERLEAILQAEREGANLLRF